MAAFRRSLKLSGKEPESASIDSICGICRMEIDENLPNCNITSCCSKPIHKNCLRDALIAMASRPLSRGNAKEDDASLKNEDREDDNRVDDEARILDVLSGQLRQRALDELNELMRLENIEAAIRRVSRAFFSASFRFKGGDIYFSFFRSNMPWSVGIYFIGLVSSTFKYKNHGHFECRLSSLFHFLE